MTTPSVPSPASRIELSERLPVPAGQSPFHVKGHVYRKMIEDVNQHVPEGMAGLLARMEEPSLPEFYAQPFTAGGWYDALPMAPLSIASARKLGLAFYYHQREKGISIARQDLNGVYKAILRILSPEFLVTKLPRVAGMYFDFGKPEPESLGPGHARLRFSGLPETLAPMLAGTLDGFYRGILEAAGGRDVDVRPRSVALDGAVRGGIALAHVEHEIQWKP